MSKVIIPVSIDLGASLERIKAIETFLLKLVPASNQTVNKLKELKDVINKVDSGALGKVPDVFKQIVPPANEVVKALERFAASSKFVSALDQAVADATASVLQFAQGSASIEDLLPVLARLTQEAGGLEEGLSLLKDLPGFDEFTQGLGEGLDLLERFGDKALDINFDPNKTISTRLREAKANLELVIAEFGQLSPEANQAAEDVKRLNKELKDSKDLAASTDIEGKFRLAGQAIAGVAAAYQTATALQAVFGTQSEATEEALKKVQAAMALTQGITGIIEGVGAFKKLGVAIYNSNILMKVYQASTVVAGVITKAFGAAVNLTSLAFKGLAVAIAATGLGLILVALGTLIPLIIKWISSNSEAETSLNGLKKQEEDLAASINKTNEAIADRNKALDFQTQKNVLLAKIAGKSQAEINKLEEEGRLKGVADAIRDRDKATAERIAAEERAQKLLETVKKKGSKKEKEEAEAAAKEIRDNATKNEKEKQDALDASIRNAAIKRLEVQAGIVDKENKIAEQKQKELIEKLKKARTESGKILTELERRNANETQQAIFKIQDEYAEKRKTLAEAGIKDFTEINKAEAEEILAVQTASNNAVLLARQNYEKALFNVIVNAVKKRKELDEQADAARIQSRELAQRAELSGIKDEGQRRLQELRNAENKDLEELEKSYENKKISLEKFLQDQAAIEAFYANQRAATQTDSQKKAEEELKAFQEKYTGLLESGLEDAFEALGTAIGEGKDPFAALSKSIGTSLANFVTSLGKDMVKLGTLFKILSEALNKLKPPGLKVAVGLALIAFGAAIRSSINKKSENKFATGGFVDGPGTDTSDSIPARLSKGEYVIKAKSVRKYGARVMEKINKGQVPVSSLARATSQENNEFFENIISRGRSGGSSKALVNRFEAPLLFANGGYVDDFYENIISRGRSGGSSKALVNRFEVPQFFSDGGLVEATRQFTRHGGTSKALVNRFEMPTLPNVNMTETFQREVPYIATTKVSGQDLKIILERADRRYSNAT